MSVPNPDRLERLRARLVAQQQRGDRKWREDLSAVPSEDLAWAIRQIEALRELRSALLLGDAFGAVMARHHSASPGPWTRDRDVIVDGHGHPVALTGFTAFPARDPQVWHRKDAEFLAHAWEDVALLLSAVRRLRDALAPNDG